MKVKLKKVVCLLCSIVVMATAFIVPMTASAVSEPLFVMQDGTKVCNINDLEMFNNVTESMFIDQLNDFLGYDITNYYYYIDVSLYSLKDRFCADIGIFEKDNGLIDETLFINGTNILADSYNSVKYSAQSNFFIRSNGLEYNQSNTFLSFRSQYAYDGCIGLITNIPNISYNDEIVKEEEKPLVPFTVTYSPELSDDMKNVVYIPSKSGGTIEQENNVLSVTVQLTDEYKKVMSENNLGSDYSQSTYSVIGCLSTEPITASTNMSTFFNEKVVLYSYAYNTYQHSGLPTYDYENETATGEYSGRGATVDYGLSPIFTIPRDRPLTLAFSISAIDFDGLQVSRDNPLYVNVVGINATHYTNKTSEITYSCASTDDFLNLTNPFEIRTLSAIVKSDTTDSSDDRGFSTHTNPHGSSGSVRENEKDINYYYSYCTSSDGFKYSTYPDYAPITLTYSDGKTYNPSTSSLSDMLNIKPVKRTDNEDISSANKGSTVEDTMKTLEDYETNLHNKTLSKNYGSFDFDTASLDEIFKETGSFFGFLTSCLSILPTYFITILISFFTVMLAIVLVEFVL